MTASGTTTDLAGAAARGSAVTLLSQALRIVLHLVATVVLARLLPAEDFGLVAMVVAVVGVSEIVRDLGLSTAAVQAKTLSQAQKSNLFWLNTAGGLVLGAVVFASADLVAHVFDEPRLEAVTRAMALIYLVNGLAAQFKAELNRALRFGALSFSDIGPQVLALIAAIVAASAGWGYWALVLQMIVQPVAGLVVVIVLSRWLPGLARRGVGTRALVRFGLGVTGTQAVGFLVRNVDLAAMGIVWGPVATGFYSRAYQLVMAPMSQVAAPLTRVAIPILSRAADDERFSDYLRKAQLVGTYVNASIYCLVVALADPIVTLALGPEWSAVTPILQALAAGGVFRAITQVSYWAYLSRGASGRQLKVYLRFQPVVVLCTLAGLPWEAVGVAIGNSVGVTVYWLISLVALRRDLGIDTRMLAGNALTTVLKVGVPSGLVAALAAQVVDGDVLRIATGLLAAAGYVAILQALDRKVRDDVRLLVRFGRKALRR